MAQTEIQKIPGAFKVPSGWPKLLFPDTETGLIADWQATDLAAGVLAGGWASRVPGGGTLKTTNQTPAPSVQLDSAGRKYLKLGTSRISTQLSWSGPMTILVSLRPDNEANATSTSPRRIYSGPSGNFRALYASTTGVQATMQTNNSNTSTGKVVAPNVVNGSLLTIATRYGDTIFDSFAAHSGWSTEYSSPGAPTQSEFGIGANSASPPDPTSFMFGDLYRVQAWNRLLTKTDVEAAVRLNDRAYA